MHSSNKDVTKYLSLGRFQILNEKDSVTSSAGSATLGDTSQIRNSTGAKYQSGKVPLITAHTETVTDRVGGHCT